MANREACEVYIQQEIDQGLAEGKKPYSIGKEVASWVGKIFETRISARTIEQRARRQAKSRPEPKNATNVAPLPLSGDNITRIPEKQDDSGFAASIPPTIPGPGAPIKYPAKTMFNRQKGDGIEWAKWSWNPVTGCEHGCGYCYARGMALRYPENYPKGFKPHFRPERLSAPQNTPLPDSKEGGERNVFAVSMGDLFGSWVPQEWIDAVFAAVREAPGWNFIFLTKNPQRYLTLEFPQNCWIGATADTQARANAALEVFKVLAKKKHPVLFLSVEPMGEAIDVNLGAVDWLIIGGQSRPGGSPLQPKWEWVEALLFSAREANCKVYFKPNLTVVPKEYPA